MKGELYIFILFYFVFLYYVLYVWGAIIFFFIFCMYLWKHGKWWQTTQLSNMLWQ